MQVETQTVVSLLCFESLPALAHTGRYGRKSSIDEGPTFIDYHEKEEKDEENKTQ